MQIKTILAAILSSTILTPILSTQAIAEDTWTKGRLLIQPKAGLSEQEFDKILKSHGGKKMRKIRSTNIFVVDLPHGKSEKEIKRLLKRNKNISFAEMDMLVPISIIPDDPEINNQWHLKTIRAPEAWGNSTGEGVTIAILDTGVNGNHPDLSARMVNGWNFYDNNADTSDVHGHGTLVAGAAAATFNNGIGVAGVAGNAKIMPLRVSSPTGYANYSTIANALIWAANNGAKVANISFGISESYTIQDAAQYMKSKGGLTVTSAGNNARLETILPHSSLITVSATDINDDKTSWSSYGTYVDVSAPGLNIYTTNSGGAYSHASGTSFSSPITGGVVALMFSANPALSPDDVEKLLFSSAKDLGTAGHDTSYGHGRVDAAAATLAAFNAPISDTILPTVDFLNPLNGATVKDIVAVDVGAKDNIGISKVELSINGRATLIDTTAPYSFSWDTREYVDGPATLTANAYDASGNYAIQTINVKIANSGDTIAPVTSLLAPKNGSTLLTKTAIYAKATDNVGITSMSVYIDGKLVVSKQTTPILYYWYTQAVTKGQHTIMVKSQDAAGNVSSSKTIVVNKK